MDAESGTSTRREFVGKAAAAAAALAGGSAVAPLIAGVAHAQPVARSHPDSPWDMSWVKQLDAAQYRVVFDARTVDNRPASLASDFFQQYKAIYDLPDTATRAVIVMRQLGTPMGMNDALWAKYHIGEATHTNDHETGQPATRNTFWRAYKGAPDYEIAMSLEKLRDRGTIVLLCNRATMNAAADMAERTGQNADAVKQEVRENLIPGAVLMPDGIFGLIRAQNAGCAYMGGV